MGIRDPAGSEVRVRVFTPCSTFILGPLTSCRGSEFQFHFHGPSCLGRTAAAMPSKFSVRQLRETGQCFENFLLIQGLDMETNREQLRIIYNRNFKTRYGLAPSLAQNRGPGSPPRPPWRGHPSTLPAPACRDAAPAVALVGPGAGAVQTSPPAWCPRPSVSVGASPPSSAPAGTLHRSPLGEPPAQPAPGCPGRGPALGDLRGEGRIGWGESPASRKRGEGGFWWRWRTEARAARAFPHRLVGGLLLPGSTNRES